MADNFDLKKTANWQKTKIVRTVIYPDNRQATNQEGNISTKRVAGQQDKVVHIDRTVVTSAMVQKSQENAVVSFDRKELDQILRVYGFKVADGEWKDYAIDMLKDRAVFSVFRRAHDHPLHCIEKIPKLTRKQGQYCVTGTDGRILKRGRDLASVLKVLEQKSPKLKVI